MENSMEVPLKRKNRPYDPAIPLLGIYLDKTINCKDTCTLKFIATLFTKTKAWKHPVSTERRKVKQDVDVHTHIHTMEYYSAMKINEIMSFTVTWMDLEIIILSEVWQINRNIIWYHFYVKSFKNDTNELIYKTKTGSQTSRKNLQLPEGRLG